MRPSYTQIETPGGPAFVRKGATEAVSAVDSIVFDCDGVLVDTRRSYDATIVAVVDRLVRRMFRLRLPWKAVASTLIQCLRNTGGFNNDWDTVYAIVMLTACTLPSRYSDGFFCALGTQTVSADVPSGESLRVLSRVVRSVRIFGRRKSRSGQASVDEFVRRSLPEDRWELRGRVRACLGYPGNPPSSLLATLFDEMYHGEELYREMYSVEPRFHRGRGFIENDRVIVSRSDLSSLSRTVRGRLALATGRPRLAAKYSLGSLFSFFTPAASVFIGDADIRATSELSAFRKPSGRSLLLALREFRSRRLVYVGDSAEDWQMVVNARRSTDSISFAGVYTKSYDPANQLRFFKHEGVELIVPTVRQLPAVLKELVRA